MRNFGVVVPEKLYRSGKYSLSQLKEVVNRHKIKQVIDLRERKPLLSASTYKKLGLHFVSHPVSEYKIITVDILNIWNKNTPTMIHCWKGSHRTGVWVGLFRLSQGWSLDDVIDEMMSYGFGDINKHKELYESIIIQSKQKS